MTVPSQLVDARNFDDLSPLLFQKIENNGLFGFDIETHDHDRHEGLNQFMKVNSEGEKSSGKRLVFDVNRTVVTGFSLYIDGDNVVHADVGNRIPWRKCESLLRSAPTDADFLLQSQFAIHDVLHQIRTLFECLKTTGGYVDLD